METPIIEVQVGDKYIIAEGWHLPPIGSQITVHKHLHDGGTYPTVEVVSHQWSLDEAADVGREARLRVIIKTKIIQAG